MISRVRAAAVKRERAEYNQTACWHDSGNSWLTPKVADLIARFFVSQMFDSRTNPALRPWQHKGRTVFQRHVINRCPNRDVRTVGEVQVAAVLMPREFDALLTGFRHVLIVEQKRRVSDCRSTDVRHQIAEHILGQSWSLVILLRNMIPFTTMADMDVIRALSIHFLMHQINQQVTRVA